MYVYWTSIRCFQMSIDSKIVGKFPARQMERHEPVVNREAREWRREEPVAPARSRQDQDRDRDRNLPPRPRSRSRERSRDHRDREREQQQRHRYNDRERERRGDHREKHRGHGRDRSRSRDRKQRRDDRRWLHITIQFFFFFCNSIHFDYFRIIDFPIHFFYDVIQSLPLLLSSLTSFHFFIEINLVWLQNEFHGIK